MRRNSSSNPNSYRPPITRIVDVPCGDMSWMSLLLPTLVSLNISYVGYDVVQSVVNSNSLRFSSLFPLVRFSRLDVAALTPGSSPSPFSGGDLVLCRHLMFHLPPAANLRVLEAMEASPAEAIMLTTFLRADDNTARDFVLAMGHKVNLFREPYCVSDPDSLVRDDDEDMYLGVWERDKKAARSPPIVRGGSCMK